MSEEKAPEIRPGLLPNGLTLKEEAFAVHYAHSCDVLSSYLHSYDVELDDDGKPPPWAVTQGYKLLKKEHIRKRIAEERKRVEEVTGVDANQVMKQAREAYELARKLKRPGDMIGATSLMAKLAGHLVDKKEVVSRTERDLTDQELEDALQKAAEEAGMVLTRVKGNAEGAG